eukprot:239228_1
MSNAVKRYCYSCFKPLKSSIVLRCTRCKLVVYCNKACQRSHWKLHKNSCAPESVFKFFEVQMESSNINQLVNKLFFANQNSNSQIFMFATTVLNRIYHLICKHYDPKDAYSHNADPDMMLHGCLRMYASSSDNNPFQTHFNIFRGLWSCPGIIELVMNTPFVSKYLTKVRQKENMKESVSFKKHCKLRKYLMKHQFGYCEDDPNEPQMDEFDMNDTQSEVYDFSYFIINLIIKTISLDYCSAPEHSSDRDGQSQLIISNSYALKDVPRWPVHLFDVVMDKLFDIFRDMDQLICCGLSIAPVANVIYQYFVHNDYRKKVIIDCKLIHSCLFLIRYDMNKHGPFNILNSITKSEWNAMELHEECKSFLYLHQFILLCDKDTNKATDIMNIHQESWRDQLVDYIDKIRHIFVYLYSDYTEFMQALRRLDNVLSIKANVIYFSPLECFTWFEKRYYEYIWKRYLDPRYVCIGKRKGEWKQYLINEGLDDMKQWRQEYETRKSRWKNMYCNARNCKVSKWKAKGVFWKCIGCTKAVYCSRKCQKYDWKYKHKLYCKVFADQKQ